MSQNKEKNASKKIGKAAAKTGKAGYLFLAKILGLSLPVIGVVVLILLVMIMFIGAVYSSMPQQGTMTGVKESEKDTEIKKEYEDLAKEYNRKETWLVDGETGEEKPYAKGEGKEKIGEMTDHHGRDRDIKTSWGTIHSTAIFYMQSVGKEKLSSEKRKEIASRLRPYYYYKNSEVTIYPEEEDEEPSTYNVKLLVEANTIHGHWQYHYKRVKEDRGDYKISHEVLDKKVTLHSERFENYLVKLCDTDGSSGKMLEKAVLEAGKGFKEEQERLAWMQKNLSSDKYVSGSMVSSQLMQYFQEAEKEYGIPWWMLAAIALQESGLDPEKGDYGNGRYGLMQIPYDMWKKHAPKLDYEPDASRDDPRAQVLVGTAILDDMGLSEINFNKIHWRNKTLPALQEYGGYKELPIAKRARYDSAEQWCRKEYAEPIWEKARSFKHRSIILWPVKGNISSRFGWREHPITGEMKIHNGIDIAASKGEMVISSSAGKVISAGWQNPADKSEGYGLRVKVSDGTHTYVYAHLNSIAVEKGDTIEPGEVIGKLGSTGASTGPHLHFGIREDSKWIDPLLILDTNID